MTMTAQVSSTEVTVAGGTVTFVDTYNGVSEILGTVQVQSTNGTPGMAILETEVGGVGTHQFVATYNGTSTFATSASTPQAVTFVAPYLSATALADTGSAPNYTFTATVSAFGPLAPTGNVTFTDTTSNVTLGTAALNSGTLLTGFAPYQSYPIANMNNGQTGRHQSAPRSVISIATAAPTMPFPPMAAPSSFCWARVMAPLPPARPLTPRLLHANLSGRGRFQRRRKAGSRCPRRRMVSAPSTSTWAMEMEPFRQPRITR